MLGRKYAEIFAQQSLNVATAKLYVGENVIEANAQEEYKGEDTENKWFRRDLVVQAEIEGDLSHVEFYDNEGNLVWKESIFASGLEGEYRIRIKLLFPYED